MVFLPGCISICQAVYIDTSEVTKNLCDIFAGTPVIPVDQDRGLLLAMFFELLKKIIIESNRSRQVALSKAFVIQDINDDAGFIFRNQRALEIDIS